MSTAPVLVTGAASGIGAALVALLRQQGREVIGLDRAPADGIIGCDLAAPDSIRTILDSLPDELGGLANVAGVPGTVDAETVLRVNALAPKLLTRGVLPRLSGAAAIVNVASVAAHRNTQPPESVAQLIDAGDPETILEWLSAHPLDGPAAYDTSKRALVDWTALLAAELIGTGVRALSVSPGPVETPILSDFTTSMGQDSMDRSVAAVGRHGRPDEVAAIVGFALSPAASWLNGIDILAEGGLTASRFAAQHASTTSTHEGMQS